MNRDERQDRLPEHFMRILIAEDHRILLNALALLLSGIEGVEVVSKHTNGKQVLAALELHEDIDLVVSDVQMPIMGGIELTLRLRERFPQVRICLLTVAAALFVGTPH